MNFCVTRAIAWDKCFTYKLNKVSPIVGRLIFLLDVGQRRLQRWLAAQKREGGLTAARVGLLFVLGRRDGVLMGEADAALDLGMPGISGLAERMIGVGLIEKRADPNDGRACG